MNVPRRMYPNDPSGFQEHPGMRLPVEQHEDGLPQKVRCLVKNLRRSRPIISRPVISRPGYQQRYSSAMVHDACYFHRYSHQKETEDRATQKTTGSGTSMRVDCMPLSI